MLTAKLEMRHSGVTQVVLGALAAALIAAPVLAHPPAPVDEHGRPIHGRVHTWMHEAKVPLVRGRVEVTWSECPGHPAFVGCVVFSHPRTVHVSRRAYEPRLVLYHELGHVFDIHVLNGRERRSFKRIMGIHREGWFHSGLSAAEWFADGYAACAVRRRIRRRLRATLYGYAPTARQHARVCRLIVVAAKPRGRPPQRPRNPPAVVDVAPPPPQETQPGPGCTLIDQLLTGCTPAPPPALP